MRRSALFVLLATACQPTPSSRGPAAEAGHAALAGARFVDAPPEGDVAAIVRGEVARARREHRRLLVYVGASWCEPCGYFHRAVESHALDAELPTLTLLAFDLDRDNARLVAAGYTSERIPLFSLPGVDGRASGHQIDGSIHGPGAVAEILPRLHALIDVRAP